jgi:hypothetical protein
MEEQTLSFIDSGFSIRQPLSSTNESTVSLNMFNIL